MSDHPYTCECGEHVDGRGHEARCPLRAKRQRKKKLPASVWVIFDAMGNITGAARSSRELNSRLGNPRFKTDKNATLYDRSLPKERT